MTDLISREDAIDAVRKCVVESELLADWNKAMKSAQELLSELPSADAEFTDLPDIPRAYYERIVGKMAHEINMLKEQLAMLCIQINELEGELATEREMAKMSSLCDNCATVGCIFQAGIEREKCAFYKNKDDLFCKSQLITCNRINECNGVCPFEEALKESEVEE